jgi:hypothetical protein
MAKRSATTKRKYYSVSKELVDLMEGLHNVELKINEQEKALGASTTRERQALEIKEILKDLKKRKKNLAIIKFRVLDNIVFPSMANITSFLEYVLVSPYLNRAFERDLKALFFAVSVMNKNKEPIFARFIEACCWSTTSAAVSKRGKVKANVPLSDFRLILMGIMMDKIWKMIPGIGQYKFKNDTFLNNVLYADFGRAVSWMKEFAHEPYGHLQFDRKRRPALF